MINQIASLRRIRSQKDLDDAVRIAKVDMHDTLAPTHVVEKNGIIVGHFTLNNVPMWNAHLSTAHVFPRETFHLINTVESKIEDAGCGFIITPVGQSSPIHPLMEKLGYTKLATVDLFVKKL